MSNVVHDVRSLVLGLPRGRVPVAAEVARSLGAELDVLVVRKLGAPGQPELAIGAIASGGGRVLNADVIADLDVDERLIGLITQRERDELERREQTFRGDRPPLDVRSREVIVVDDGLATGATMRAAVAALRSMSPARIVVAVPVGSQQAIDMLRREADGVVCVQVPQPFYAVGVYYDWFEQMEDDEVRLILSEFESGRTSPPAMDRSSV